MKSVSDSPRGSSESALSSPAENGEQASPAVLRFDRFVTVEWFARTGRGKGLKISDAVNTAWLDSSELRVNDVITQKGGVPAR